MHYYHFVRFHACHFSVGGAIGAEQMFIFFSSSIHFRQRGNRVSSNARNTQINQQIADRFLAFNQNKKITTTTFRAFLYRVAFDHLNSIVRSSL